MATGPDSKRHPAYTRFDLLLCSERWCRLVACRVGSRHSDHHTDQKVRGSNPFGRALC